MRISPITHNFTRVNVRNQNFGKYADEETSKMSKDMLQKFGKPEYDNKGPEELWEILGASEMLTLSKKDNALWAEVHRPYFDSEAKRMIANGYGPLTANSFYGDFIERVEKSRVSHPVRTVREGVWGPITDPETINDLAWATYLRDPNRFDKPKIKEPSNEPYIDPYVDEESRYHLGGDRFMPQ